MVYVRCRRDSALALVGACSRLAGFQVRSVGLARGVGGSGSRSSPAPLLLRMSRSCRCASQPPARLLSPNPMHGMPLYLQPSGQDAVRGVGEVFAAAGAPPVPPRPHVARPRTIWQALPSFSFETVYSNDVRVWDIIEISRLPGRLCWSSRTSGAQWYAHAPGLPGCIPAYAQRAAAMFSKGSEDTRQAGAAAGSTGHWSYPQQRHAAPGGCAHLPAAAKRGRLAHWRGWRWAPDAPASAESLSSQQ